MSCGCDSGSSYDGGYGSGYGYNGICNADTPYPSVSSESVPSLINNLTYALYGQIQKNVTNGQVTWTIPCDPNSTATINGIPRIAGEGLLCYIIRALNLTTATAGYVTANGFETLTNKTLTLPVINGAALSGTINGGTFTSTILTSPTINTATINTPTINTATINTPTINTATINTATISNLTAIGTLALPSGSITTAMIANGSIIDIDISATAAIANGKLAGNPVSTNTASTIVLRDASGNFSAGTITSAQSIVTGASTLGTASSIINTDTGGHAWTINSNGSANSGGAGALIVYDATVPATRLSIGTTGVIDTQTNPITNCPTTAKAWAYVQVLANTSGAAQTFIGNNVASIVRGATAGLYTITLTSGTFNGAVVISPITGANNAGARVFLYSGNTCVIQMYSGVTSTDMAFNMVYFSN